MPKRTSKSRGRHPPEEPTPDRSRASSPESSPRRSWRPDQPGSKRGKKRRRSRGSPSPQRPSSPAGTARPGRVNSATPPRPSTSPPGRRRARSTSPPASPGRSQQGTPRLQRVRAVSSPPGPRTAAAAAAGRAPSPLPSLLIPRGGATGGRLQLSLESTLSATSPECHPPIRSLVIPAAQPARRALTPEPPRTPPRCESPGIPRTPGYSSDERPPRRLDFTRTLPVELDVTAQSGDTPWDLLSQAESVRSPPPVGFPADALQDVPLSWYTVVDTVFQSGLVDRLALPESPQPVRSVIGGPPPAKRRRTALPPSPLAAASLSSAMRSCWGGDWPTHLQHQPPPPNAFLHPTPAIWVPDFKTRFHAGPGFDLKPARLSAREKEWAGSSQPSVDYSWLNEIEMMARAQLSSISALEWLLGILFDSTGKASPAQLQTLRDFAVRELTHTANFGGAVIAASKLARRKAVLDRLTLSSTTRNWLQLQPVGLDSSQGLFGPASAAVPDLLRQQQPPARPTAARQHSARQAPRPGPSYDRRGPANRERAGPSATYTPAAARETAEAASRPRQSRGSSSKGPRRRS